MKAFEQFFAAILIASRDAAILAMGIGLMLLVLRRLPPAWRHGLWLLVAVRLLMPVLPESFLSWQNWRILPTSASSGEAPGRFPHGADDFGPAAFTGIPVQETATPLPASVSTRPARLWNLRKSLPWVWATGALIWLMLLAMGWLRFQRQVTRLELRRHPGKAEIGSILARLCGEQGIARVPGLILTDAVDGPALAGWWRPCILLPGATLAELSGAQLRLVMLHELGHLRRRDVAVNWVLCLIHAVHWFNPVVWWAFRHTRIEAERATDAWVLRRSSAGTSADYGETLIRLLESIGRTRPAAPGLVGVLESRLGLRARLSEIRRYRKSSPWLAAAGLAILSGFAVVGLTQPPTKSEKPTPPEKTDLASTESSTTDPGDASQVQLSVKVWRKTSDGTEKLIATPVFVSMIDEWSLFEDRQEIGYPTAYDPPNLPEELASKASGGGTVGETATAEKKWETNSRDVILPPHPAQFERRSIGWTLKLRPERTTQGKLRVAGVVEQEELKGFVNHGLPIVAKLPKGLFGREKSAVVEENRQLLPVFMKRKQELRFEPRGNLFVAKLVSDSRETDSKNENFVEGFADDLRSAELPELRFEIEAKPAGDGEVEKAAGDERQIYLTTRFIELDHDLSGLQGALTPNFSLPILTDPQFQVVVRALSRRTGVKMMTSPSVILENGDSANIEVTKEFIYPGTYDPPVFSSEPKGFPVSPSTPKDFAHNPVGVRLQVKSTILADNRIELELAPWSGAHREFLNFGSEIRQLNDGTFPGIQISENRIDMPVFDIESQRTKLRIDDGETVVVGGFVRYDVQSVEESLPVIGVVDEYKKVYTRSVFVFVTARLIDASGSPRNSHQDSPPEKQTQPPD